MKIVFISALLMRLSEISFLRESNYSVVHEVGVGVPVYNIRTKEYQRERVRDRERDGDRDRNFLFSCRWSWCSCRTGHDFPHRAAAKERSCYSLSVAVHPAHLCYLPVTRPARHQSTVASVSVRCRSLRFENNSS